MRRDLIYSERRTQSRLSRAATAGQVVRIARGVYSPDVATPVEQQVREHLWELVAHFVPDAVIVDRSAATGGRLTLDGTLFVASQERVRDAELPGLRIAVRTGRPIAGDVIWPKLITPSPCRSSWIFSVNNPEPGRSMLPA